jgi:undecaprenyl diphosphate synthase
MNSDSKIALPRHVAIIMDGNGRWARMRGYPRFYGHVRGSARVKEIVRSARERGIRALTLYAFSTENWKRPDQELNVLWGLMRKYIRREVRELKQNGIRLRVIGEIDRLPLEARTELLKAMDELSGGREMDLTFALSYGSRNEITQAVRAIARECQEGKLPVEQIDEQVIASHLATAYLGDVSDVDLMIRTSGEKRLSNYLLWQCSFPETLWPDYSVEEFNKSLETFKQRDRRFGGVSV